MADLEARLKAEQGAPGLNRWQKRGPGEDAKKEVEAAKAAAEDSRKDAEEARKDAEAAKKETEAARKELEEARKEVERVQQEAAAAKAAEEAAKQEAAGAKRAAEEARKEGGSTAGEAADKRARDELDRRLMDAEIAAQKAGVAQKVSRWRGRSRRERQRAIRQEKHRVGIGKVTTMETVAWHRVSCKRAALLRLDLGGQQPDSLMPVMVQEAETKLQSVEKSLKELEKNLQAEKKKRLSASTDNKKLANILKDKEKERASFVARLEALEGAAAGVLAVARESPAIAVAVEAEPEEADKAPALPAGPAKAAPGDKPVPLPMAAAAAAAQSAQVIQEKGAERPKEVSPKVPAAEAQAAVNNDGPPAGATPAGKTEAATEPVMAAINLAELAQMEAPTGQGEGRKQAPPELNAAGATPDPDASEAPTKEPEPEKAAVPAEMPAKKEGTQCGSNHGGSTNMRPQGWLKDMRADQRDFMAASRLGARCQQRFLSLCHCSFSRPSSLPADLVLPLHFFCSCGALPGSTFAKSRFGPKRPRGYSAHEAAGR